MYFPSNHPILPRPIETGDKCDCGRPKAQGDFLCRICRRELEERLRQNRDEPDLTPPQQAEP